MVPLAALLPLLLHGCQEDQQQIMAGSDYVCVLTNGRIECQTNGDMPDMGQTSPPERDWISVVGGQVHLCGFGESGTPRCWGWNESGQTDIPDGLSIASFFLGYVNTCVIETDGAIACWGNEWTGLNESPAGAFVQAAAAERVACARAESGEWTCWGGWWGVDESPDGWIYDWKLPEVPLVELVGSASNICGLDDDGAISCWGATNYGLTDPPDKTGFRDLSVSVRHACAIDEDDLVQCWGDVEPWRRWATGTWRTFVAGASMDCGIREDGKIDCWGCTFVDPFTCDWDD